VEVDDRDSLTVGAPRYDVEVVGLGAPPGGPNRDPPGATFRGAGL